MILGRRLYRTIRRLIILLSILSLIVLDVTLARQQLPTHSLLLLRWLRAAAAVSAGSRSSLSIAAEIDRDDHRHVEIDSVIFFLLLLHGVAVLVRLYIEHLLKS